MYCWNSLLNYPIILISSKSHCTLFGTDQALPKTSRSNYSTFRLFTGHNVISYYVCKFILCINSNIRWIIFGEIHNSTFKQKWLPISPETVSSSSEFSPCSERAASILCVLNTRGFEPPIYNVHKIMWLIIESKAILSYLAKNIIAKPYYVLQKNELIKCQQFVLIL